MIPNCQQKKPVSLLCATHGCTKPGLISFDCDVCNSNHSDCIKLVSFQQVIPKLICKNQSPAQQQKKVVKDLEKLKDHFINFIKGIKQLDLTTYGLLYNYEQFNSNNINKRTGNDFAKLILQPDQIVTKIVFGKGIQLQIQQMIQLFRQFSKNINQLLAIEEDLSILSVKYTHFENVRTKCGNQKQQYTVIKQFINDNLEQLNKTLKNRQGIHYIRKRQTIPQYDNIVKYHKQFLDLLWKLITYLHTNQKFDQFSKYLHIYRRYFSGQFGVFNYNMSSQKQLIILRLQTQAAIKSGNDELSIKCLERIENLTKEEIQILFQLYRKRKNYSKLLELKPRLFQYLDINPQIYLFYSQMAQNKYDWDQAIKMLEAYENASKRKADIQRFTKLYMRKNMFKQAFERIQSHNSQDNASVWQQKAIIAQNQLKYKEALEYYLRALRVNQKEGKNNQLRIRCNNKIIELADFIQAQQKQKSIQKAKLQNEQLNAKNKLNSFTFSQNKFRQALKTKDVNKSRQVFQQLVKLYPKPQYYYEMSQLLYEKATYKDTNIMKQIYQYLTIAINLNKDFLEAIQLRGQSKLFLREYKSALQDFAYVLKRKEQKRIMNHQSHFWIGCCKQRLEKIDEAEQQYRQQMRINFYHYASIFNLCKILYKKRAFQQLTKLLTILIDNDTNYKVESLQMMGNIYEQKSNLQNSMEKRLDYWQEAEKWYMKAYDIEKNNNTIKGVDRIKAKLSEYR